MGEQNDAFRHCQKSIFAVGHEWRSSFHLGSSSLLYFSLKWKVVVRAEDGEQIIIGDPCCFYENRRLLVVWWVQIREKSEQHRLLWARVPSEPEAQLIMICNAQRLGWYISINWVYTKSNSKNTAFLWKLMHSIEG